MPHCPTDKRFLCVFGEHIRRLRQAEGWSQEEFADRAGLHRTYIGSIERGEKNLSLLNLRRIADALGVQLRDLFAFDYEAQEKQD